MISEKRKKSLIEKIPLFTKNQYFSEFYKVLLDLCKGKLKKDNQLFVVRSERSAVEASWKCVYFAFETESTSADFLLPKVVFRYLLKLGSVKLSKIMKLAKMEEVKPVELVKEYLNECRKAIDAEKHVRREKALSSSKFTNKSFKQKTKIFRSGKSLIRSETTKDEEEKKKVEGSVRLTNIFMKSPGSRNQPLGRNTRVKIFEGKFTKTFLLSEREERKPPKFDVLNKKYKLRESSNNLQTISQLKTDRVKSRVQSPRKIDNFKLIKNEQSLSKSPVLRNKSVQLIDSKRSLFKSADASNRRNVFKSIDCTAKDYDKGNITLFRLTSPLKSVRKLGAEDRMSEIKDLHNKFGLKLPKLNKKAIEQKFFDNKRDFYF